MARGTLLSGGTGREAWSKGIPPKLAFFVVERLLRSGELVSEGDVIRMASHTVSLKSDQAGLRDALLKAHVDGAFTPPNLKDVLEELSVDAKAAAPVLKLLCEDGIHPNEKGHELIFESLREAARKAPERADALRTPKLALA